MSTTGHGAHSGAKRGALTRLGDSKLSDNL